MSTDPILFFDLKTPSKRLRADIERRLNAILDHGQYIGGPEVTELEQKLAAFTGARHALAVASGTDALVIALMGEEIGPGDAVFLPAFTYNATANAVLMTGATPVFVDVDRQTCNIDPIQLEAAIERVVAEGRLKPRLVIAVDLYGLPADYATIGPVARKHGMLVLSDAAQALGGGQGNKRIGALCEMTATSFYPSKTLGAYGDGGAMFTDDDARLDRWASIRWHGTDAAKKESIRVGLNGRLDSMQCAVVLSKMTIFEAELEDRAGHAARYRARLGGKVMMQEGRSEDRHAFGLFTIMVDERDRVMAALKEQGIPSAVYYAKSLHRHAAFAAYAPAEPLANCDWLADHALSLPFHPYLTDAQIDGVCDALLRAL
ncbi:MAG: DegT/DnrJ/EryC1/StrS family aminotransferase [Alphaproteobacteria bacterium]|nr:DegT/DnrJ/EryC1/StrS family aminotransferase [Alphaproteobacteria bacterium]